VTIEVQLFATLATYLPEGRTGLEMSDDATVADVIRRLRIPEALPRIVLVNGQDAEESRPLAPGDVVSLFPPLAGGAGPRG
jgi:molybdopterin converting factor small subunit